MAALVLPVSRRGAAHSSARRDFLLFSTRSGRAEKAGGRAAPCWPADCGFLVRGDALGPAAAFAARGADLSTNLEAATFRRVSTRSGRAGRKAAGGRAAPCWPADRGFLVRGDALAPAAAFAARRRRVPLDSAATMFVAGLDAQRASRKRPAAAPHPPGPRIAVSWSAAMPWVLLQHSPRVGVECRLIPRRRCLLRPSTRSGRVENGRRPRKGRAPARINDRAFRRRRRRQWRGRNLRPGARVQYGKEARQTRARCNGPRGLCERRFRVNQMYVFIAQPSARHHHVLATMRVTRC